MHSCSRKHSMVTKRGSVQKRKMSESQERTNMVEVVTSPQVAMLAAWSRIALYFFSLITEESLLISPCYLQLCLQMDISFLCLSLLFFSQLFVRPPQTTILPFCISFSWGWS